MKQAFHQLFWGFLLILLEIHIIVIDILPEPVGYYLIVSGVGKLVDDYPIGKKASNLANLLLVISIPTVFIQQNINLDQLGQFGGVSVLTAYTTILGLLKLVLVFYVFQLMVEIARTHHEMALKTRTEKTFSIYMAIMLLFEITRPFVMNLGGDLVMGYVILSAMVGLLLEVVFLVLLRTYRNADIRSA